MCGGRLATHNASAPIKAPRTSVWQSGERAVQSSRPHPISVSVFFPCYNEEENVERTTLSALMACQRLFADYEVIIVNDGSKDATGAIADRLSHEHEHVRAVHNNPNRGYGGALQRGFAEATKDWVFYTDGDGQFDFEGMERLIPMLDEFDIISPYRIHRKDSLLRKVNARLWGTLVRRLFDMKIRDIDCAFKMYPREFLDSIELRSEGALIDTEMLAKATRMGYRIGQIGVNHYPRTAGEQTGANIRVILRAFAELFKLRKHIIASTVDVRRRKGSWADADTPRIVRPKITRAA